MAKAYDAIIIGTGQAGPFLASRLAAAGMKVAIAERKFFGGTCVNTGCIPTKAMVASAYAARVAQRAREYGVMIEGDVRVDMKKMKARKDAISGKSRTGIETWLKGTENCTVYQGHARFESAREVRVGDELISSERIFINVGGRAAIPSMPGIDQIAYLTNSSMMEVDFLPDHLVIIGGSYIGLEFGQMFRRFGSKVTIVEMMPRLIAREDEDVSTVIQQILEQEGIELRLNAKCVGLTKHSKGISVRADCSGGSSPSALSISASYCWQSGATQTLTILASTKQPLRPMNAVTFSWMTSYAPTYRVSGRWEIAMAKVDLLIPPTTILRLWPPTFSTTTSAGSRTVFWRTLSTLIRRWGGPA